MKELKHFTDATQLTDELARRVVAARLETPVIFFLEAHKPLGTLAHSALLILTPLLRPLIGRHFIDNLLEVLAKPEQLENFLIQIERYSLARSGEISKTVPDESCDPN